MTPITGYERYLINDAGEIYDTKRNAFKNTPADGNYAKASLFKDGVRTKFNVYQLVAEHFVSKPEDWVADNYKVTFIDSNTFNTKPSNLRWCIRKRQATHKQSNAPAEAKPTKAARDPHYLTNKYFLAEIITSKQIDKLTRKCEQMFMLLAERTIKKMRYYNPSDREDCLQTGLLQLFANWRSFDETRSSNAFAYFTEIFKRGMALGWNQLRTVRDDSNTVRFHSLDTGNDGERMFGY